MRNSPNGICPNKEKILFQKSLYYIGTLSGIKFNETSWPKISTIFDKIEIRSITHLIEYSSAVYMTYGMSPYKLNDSNLELNESHLIGFLMAFLGQIK